MRATFILIFTIILFSGCSTKNPQANIKPSKVIVVKKEKPYEFKFKPIIGTQTPDDKVLVDMGVVLRVWIQSYKTRTGNLIASHDVYIWGKKPDFIVGNPIPTPTRGILTPHRKLPFMLSNEEVDRSDLESNENIRKFINSVYEKNNKPKTEKQIQKANQFDLKIKEFLKDKSVHKE